MEKETIEPIPEYVMAAIIEELNRATSKFPKWPSDPIHASSIVVEEAGELARAALKYTYEDGDPNEMWGEAVQTAVTAIRFLMYRASGAHYYSQPSMI
jgi:hypothetical protein